MKLDDFITSIISEIESKTHAEFGIAHIKRTANHIYSVRCSSPNFVQVRFGSPIIRLDNSHAYNLNLRVEITPGHPAFRPWLKRRVVCCAEPLYLLSSEHKPPQMSLCAYDAGTEITDIVKALETRIVERVTLVEHYTRSLYRLTDQYKLNAEDFSALIGAVVYLTEHTVYDQVYFANAENRNSLLPQ